MAAVTDTLSSLQRTSKGQLRYDRFWYKEGSVEAMLKECTSPPSVSMFPRSPSYNQSPEGQRSTHHMRSPNYNQSPENRLSTDHPRSPDYTRSPENRLSTDHPRSPDYTRSPENRLSTDHPRSPDYTRSPENWLSTDHPRSPDYTRSPENRLSTDHTRSPDYTQSPENRLSTDHTRSPDYTRSPENRLSTDHTRSPDYTRSPENRLSTDHPRSPDYTQSPENRLSTDHPRSPDYTQSPENRLSTDHTRSPDYTKSPEGRPSTDYTRSPDDTRSPEERSTDHTRSPNYTRSPQKQSTDSPQSLDTPGVPHSLPSSPDTLPKSLDISDDSIISPQVTLVEVAIKDYEARLQNEAKAALDERQWLFEKTSKLLVQQAESALARLYFRKDEEARQQRAAAEAEYKARSVETQLMEQQLREHHRQHAKRLDTKMREAEAGRRQQEEEEAKKKQVIQQRLNMITAGQLEVKTTAVQVGQLLTVCQYPQYVPEAIKKAPQVFAQILSKMEAFLQDAIASSSSKGFQEALELTGTVRSLSEKIKSAIEIANKKGKAEADEAATKAATTAAAAAASAAAAAATSAATVTTNTGQQSGTPATTPDGASISKAAMVQADELLCVDERIFLKYQKLQNNLAEVKKTIVPIINDPAFKKYKFDLQKAINIPVNAIAPTSGNHLRDKLRRLTSVLHGHPVDSAGRRVSANDHPAGISFCKDLFARKIVKQGEEQVSSNHESAFAIAAVTVGVLCEFQDMADLILAHFHARCPYIVPYYLPKKPGMTNEDYYKSLGYLYVDGAVEEQDKYLKRMSGIMRLYAAILVSSPPRGINTLNPHGVRFAWQWLASILNLEPRPYITATMIYDMLQVAGHALFETYHSQFVKLLSALYTDCMPKIKKVAPEGSGGPIVRLELFLQQCIKTNSIPKPDGMLPQYFW